jgi:hypothetical protein
MNRFLLILISILVVTAHISSAASLFTPHFTITADGFSDRYASRAADSAERSLARIADALGTTPDSTITIVLTDTAARFRALTEGTLPDWSAAAALPGRKIIVSPLAGQKIEMDKIIAHEIVHVVIEDAVRGKYVPRWFHEGCAERYSGEWGIRGELYMSWMVVRGNLLSFRDIQNVFSRGSLDAGLAYDQAMLAVRRFTAEYGDRAIPRVLAAMRGGKEFQGAFREATGYTPEEFEHDYLAFLHDRYGVRMLITLVPGTWTLMMVLFLVVYVVKRRRSRRKLAEWAAAGDGAALEGKVEDSGDEFVEEESEAFSDDDTDSLEPGSNVLKFKPRPRKYRGVDGEK